MSTSPSSAIRSSRRAAALALLIVSAACSGSSTAAPPPASPTHGVSGCTAPEAEQFDFWVGSWTGTWTDPEGAATATDVVIKSGCEVDETFRAARFLQHVNYSATSKSHWDSTLSAWVQDYSDSVGERSRWLGGFAAGAMTLVGPQVGSRQQKIVWRNIQPDRWIWEYDSSNDGATWAVVLVVTYQRS